jgi:hypothetical protein
VHPQLPSPKQPSDIRGHYKSLFYPTIFVPAHFSGDRRKILRQQQSPLEKHWHIYCRYVIGRGSFRRRKKQVESSMGARVGSVSGVSERTATCELGQVEGSQSLRMPWGRMIWCWRQRASGQTGSWAYRRRAQQLGGAACHVRQAGRKQGTPQGGRPHDEEGPAVIPPERERARCMSLSPPKCVLRSLPLPRR